MMVYMWNNIEEHNSTKVDKVILWSKSLSVQYNFDDCKTLGQI